MSKSLRIILPEMGCGKIVVRFDMFTNLFSIIANDENQFGEIGKFKERFEEIVEDGTSRDMQQRLRGGEGVRSEACAAARGGDNDFHWDSSFR